MTKPNVLVSRGPTKLGNRRLWFCAAIVVSLLGSLWFAFAHQSDLERPVLEGKPIGYWMAYMASDRNDDRDAVRDRLNALGPMVVAPLLAALHDRPSAIQLKITPFLYDHFPAVARWLYRRPQHNGSMAAYTLSTMPPDRKIRDALVKTIYQCKSEDR